MEWLLLRGLPEASVEEVLSLARRRRFGKSATNRGSCWPSAMKPSRRELLQLATTAAAAGGQTSGKPSKRRTLYYNDARHYYLFVFEPPIVLEADTANTSSAELCALPPGVERVGPRTIRFRTDDFREAYRCLLAWTYLGASEAPRYAGT